MATITPTILQNNKRKDDTWIVVFRLTHKRQSVYIKTSHEVSKSHLNKDNSLKQKFVIDYLSSDILLLKEKISRLGFRTESMTARQLKDILTSGNEKIDFIGFCEEYYKEIKKTLKPNTVGTYRTVINHIIDFQAGIPLYTGDITSKYIVSFMKYVQEPKKIRRMVGVNHKHETEIETKTKSGNSLYTLFFRFRKMFDACKYRYNDEELGIIRISNDPFSRVPAPRMENTQKRNLSVEEIRKIRDYQPTTWTELVGRNIFMLSFYLCGINIVDLFGNIEKYSERLNYNRSKVENIRMDKAFISIRIPKDAKPYVDWFVEVKKRWTNSKNLVLSTNKGLKSIAKKTGITTDVSTYYARHSFATIARNDLNISKDDIALALNHVSNDNRMTDTYLAPDWSKIDRVQESVINFVNIDMKN